MIKYRLKSETLTSANNFWSARWYEIDPYWNIMREDFEGYDFKIDNDVYSEWTDEFAKQLMWFNLGKHNGHDYTE